MRYRAQVTGKVLTGGGQRGQASLYELSLPSGEQLRCDYIEVATDGFRTLVVGETAWCSRSGQDPAWAVDVVPVRDHDPLQLLGIAHESDEDDDPLADLWL